MGKNKINKVMEEMLTDIDERGRDIRYIIKVFILFY